MLHAIPDRPELHQGPLQEFLLSVHVPGGSCLRACLVEQGRSDPMTLANAAESRFGLRT